MNTTNYIRIFRGDDSDALGYQTIVGTIKTDLDLTGCKAVFRFLGFYAEFNPIPEDKKLTIVIPAQASRGFPPGVGYASLKVFDSLDKIRTFTNRIPVIVDTMTPSCGCGEFEVSFSPFPELEPLKIFIGPNSDDFDQYTGFVSKIIDRASLVKYGLAMLADAMSEDGGASGKAASPLAVKAAYDAIIKELTDNYYDAEQTEEAIDRVAAYYITYNAAGAAFPTRADLINATTYYSGGVVRVPTRNDYAVVLADETHGGAEWRYIYAIPGGSTTGQWEAQYPIETNDYAALSNKPQINGHTLTGSKAGADLGLLDLAGDQTVGGVKTFADGVHVKLNRTDADFQIVDEDGNLGTFTITNSMDTGRWCLFARYANSTTCIVSLPVGSGTLARVEDIAPDFMAVYGDGHVFAANTLVCYQGVLYRCILGYTFADGDDYPPYDSTHWALATVEDVLAALRTGKANKVANATAGNLAALDADGDIADAGYHFEVRNGIPCIVQYT